MIFLQHCNRCIVLQQRATHLLNFARAYVTLGPIPKVRPSRRRKAPDEDKTFFEKPVDVKLPGQPDFLTAIREKFEEDHPKAWKPVPGTVKLSEVKELLAKMERGQTLPFLPETHPIYTSLLNEAKGKLHEGEQKYFFVEGFRNIAEGFKAGFHAKYLFYKLLDDIRGLDIVSDVTEVWSLKRGQLRALSSLVTPPGLMAVFSLRDLEKLRPHPLSIPVSLIMDNIRDPSNIGALLRTAAARCANVWEAKVIRSGMGAHFHQPIRCKVPFECINDYCQGDRQTHLYILLDCKSTSATSLYEVPSLVSSATSKSPRTFSIVIGNEATGPSEECESFFSRADLNFLRVRIPLREGSLDSLNVNAAFAATVFFLKYTLFQENRQYCWS
ncbi:unnamed protein product [Cyprideis torosa]|uniref:Uncharacterized protein n=1 Tax=Cyprideis torosa TaxID=163714 RepID=A0A7R8WNF9_9CRUS|nr:unnamed protein product [Cyprideis torosa]CAG0900608.1 unnamed protein product [Cyprideis torosa]